MAALLVAGAGHVAIGRFRRALAWFLFETALAVLVAIGALTGHPSVMWLGVAGILLGRVGAVIDVIRISPAAALPRWSLTVLLWIALVVAGRLESFLARQTVEAFRIPAGSMAPTLLVGDHIFINKLDRNAKRGDVIVFKYPEDPDKDFIKRVIAIEGDIVEIRQGFVYLNGQKVPREHVGTARYVDISEETSPPRVEKRTADEFQETLDGKRIRIYLDPSAQTGGCPPPARYGCGEPIKVPPQSVFVMGDNRDLSHDSRYWGFVPRRYIKGRASFIWWSSGPDDVRWDRCGKPVQ